MRGNLARSSIRTIAMLSARVAIQGTTLVLVTRLLGPSIYGGYIAAASLAVVLGLIPNLGSGYLLMARAEGSRNAVGDTWNYGWPLSIGVGIVLTAIFPFLASMLTGGALSTSDLLLIGIPELLISPLTLLLSFVLQSVDRVATGQIILTVPMLLRALVAAACLAAGTASLSSFIALQAAATLAGLMAAFSITAYVVDLPKRPRRPTADELRSGASYAAMHVVAANPTELDKITSPRLLGTEMAGIYSASSRVMNAVVMPVIGVLLASQPRLFRHASEPTAEGRRLVSLLGMLAFAWGLVSATAMIIFAPLIPSLFGKAYSGTAVLMPWVAMAAPFLSLRLAAGTILVALGHPLQRLRFELIGIVLLAALLIGGSHLGGSQGMACALCLAESAMACYGWVLVRQANRRL